ncbi:MAG TPA: phage holin family protein [Clostridiaceae bacterium]|nr:phage holin family protein [Clostridiaceae bacterium]
MAEEYKATRDEPFSITHLLIRLVVGAIVLAITAALTPGFSIAGIWPLIFAAIILALLDYLALKILGVNASPFGRGITGFILAAAIIYITQFFVAGYTVSLWGALIGALVYGIVDLIIPGKAM